MNEKGYKNTMMGLLIYRLWHYQFASSAGFLVFGAFTNQDIEVLIISMAIKIFFGEVHPGGAKTLGQDQKIVGEVVVVGAVGHELLLGDHTVLVRVHVGEHLNHHHTSNSQIMYFPFSL